MTPREINVKEDDVLGIHYKQPVPGTGVVPYVQSDSLCCGLQTANLSRVQSVSTIDDDALNLGGGGVFLPGSAIYRKNLAVLAEIHPSSGNVQGYIAIPTPVIYWNIVCSFLIFFQFP